MRRKNKKKRVRKEKIWGMFIVLIMVGSAFGIIFGGFASSSQTIKYNGVKLKASPEGWTAKVDGRVYNFRYDPKVLEGMKVDDSFKDMIIRSPQVDMTSEFNTSYIETIGQVEFDIASVLSYMNIYSETGFSEDNSYGLPVFKCSRKSIVPLIYFTEGDETSITVDENCIIASAENNDMFFALRDRIIYSLLGIMDQ